MNIDIQSRRRFILGLGVAASLVSLPITAAKSKTSKPKVAFIGPNKIANVPLLTHEGKAIHFFDDMVKDKIIVINMMYADCEGICPLATSNLMQVQRLVANKTKHLHGMPVQICSLTLRPEQDTVAHLSHYVSEHRIPAGWSFLTGDPEMVKLLRYSLGFYDPDPAVDGVNATHTGMLRIGNEQLARWGMMPAQANPRQIVNAIGHVARWPSA